MRDEQWPELTAGGGDEPYGDEDGPRGEMTPAPSLPDTFLTEEEDDGRDLPPDLKPEVRVWVMRFRLLLKRTGLSARAYATRHDISAATLTNYRKGRTMPKESAVQTLFNDQPPGLTDDVVEQTWALWEDALRVASVHEYEKHLLRGQARQAVAKADSLQVLVETLSRDVVDKDARIGDLDAQMKNLQQTFNQNAVDDHRLLEDLREQIARLTEERDKLSRSEAESRRHLEDAERTRDAALHRARQLEAQLIRLEEETALELNTDNTPAEASETITALELRLQELQQLHDQDLQQFSQHADQISHLEQTIRTASTQLYYEQERTEQQRDKKKKARNELASVRSLLTQSQSQHNQLRSAYEELKERHEELGIKYSELTAQYGGLKKQSTAINPRAHYAALSTPSHDSDDWRPAHRTPTWALMAWIVVSLVAAYVIGNGFAYLQQARHDTIWQLAVYSLIAMALTWGGFGLLDDELTRVGDFCIWMAVVTTGAMVISVFLPDIPLLHTMAVNLQSPLNPD
ncbi:hypothetical protein ABZZ74_47745 [Streptomyces sp. NPDC006476]|uniref:hypothetical protein n=1 Tax=Streptomyces sp. NPDC006476 TaxID=3157175 RepID=UPI00339E6B0C